MERKYEVKSQDTINTITRLLDRGIDRMSVILRHSDRHYTRDYRMEPFMGLTEAGKSYAQDLGRHLPAAISPRVHSSHFGRCIETAYLIDKGYTLVHGSALPHNRTHDTLAPFYINDLEKGIALMEASGTQGFIRNWFDKAIDESVMLDPVRTAEELCAFMRLRLSELCAGEAALCVTHDWNIFPILEFKFGLPIETAGDVGYLEGVVFYEEHGRTWAVTWDTDPVEID